MKKIGSSTALIAISLSSGYFFTINFGAVAGLSLTWLTVTDIMIIILSLFGIFKHNPKIYLGIVVFTLFFALSGIHNEGVVTYSLMFFANVILTLAIMGKNIDTKIISKIGRYSLYIGAAVLALYVRDVVVNGPTVAANPALWDESGHLFRYTLGSFFAFQGFSINPNAAAFPYYVSYLFYRMDKNENTKKTVLLFLLILIMVTIATNSRGNLFILAFIVIYELGNLKIKINLILITLLATGFALVAVSLNVTALIDSNKVTEESILFGLKEKFDRSTDDLRKEKIDNGLRVLQDHPIIGGGLGVAQAKHKMTYENGYIEAAASFGYLGLMILISAILLIGFKSKMTNEQKALLTIFLIINVFNTMYMHPVAMIALGMAFAKLNGVTFNGHRDERAKTGRKFFLG